MSTTTIMSKNDALRWLLHSSPVSVASYTELAETFGWQRTKAWRVVQGWKRKGWVETETAPDTGRMTVTVVPTAIPIAVANGAQDDVLDDDEGDENDTLREGTASLPNVSEGRARPPVLPPSEQSERPDVATVYATYVRRPREAAAPADALDWLARLVAIGMAIVTAYFSIHGLLTLFPGDEIGVTVFGIGVECLKVTGVMYIAAHARSLWWLWRWLAIGAVIIAAGLNSASVYAKFAALHSQSPAAAAATREASAADLDARIEAAQTRLDDVRRRAGAIDSTVSGAGQRSNAKGMQRVVTTTRDDRAGLTSQQQQTADEIARLKADRGRVLAAGHQAAAEELPVTLMASLFSTDAATVLRWLVCAVVICGDPAALILLAAVGSRRKGGAA